MLKTQIFRTMLEKKKLIQMPGCYDAITAKLIEQAGYQALYVTGSGVSLSLMAQPDVNTVSYYELYERVAQISSAVDIPILVDIDTGFGGPLNLVRLVKDFERLDIAAVQIEDQVAPKRCGHEPGRRVVSAEEMIDRIRVIADTRKEEGLLIAARTDARTSLGIEEAIRRGNAYLKAGADIIFIESPESKEEIVQIGQETEGPVLFNNVEGGRSPFMAAAELQNAGFACVIYPNALTRIMCKSAQKLLSVLKESGTTESVWPDMLNHKEVWKLFGSEQCYELESRYTKFRQ